MGPRAILDWSEKSRLHLDSISGPSVFVNLRVSLVETFIYRDKKFIARTDIQEKMCYPTCINTVHPVVYNYTAQTLHFTDINNLLLEFCQYTVLRSIFYGVQTFAKLRPYISVIWTLWSLLEIGDCSGSIRANIYF